MTLLTEPVPLETERETHLRNFEYKTVSGSQSTRSKTDVKSPNYITTFLFLPHDYGFVYRNWDVITFTAWQHTLATPVVNSPQLGPEVLSVCMCFLKLLHSALCIMSYGKYSSVETSYTH